MVTTDELSTTARTVLAAAGSALVTIGRDGRGTGIVFAPGKVLTNSHNLRDRSTSVTFADGRTVQGTVAGVDDDGDLVVLDADTGDTPQLGWAADAPQVGDVVFALSRGGQRTRISFGMVSAIDLPFHGPRGRQVHGGVEHTAPLVRGSSGGPIVNAAGDVLGVNTHRTGRGFYVARPIDDALRARIADLAEGHSVVRPRLGVALAPPHVARRLRAAVGLPERDGLLVRGVESGSPADRAGINEGDLLIAAAGVSLDSIDALHEAVASASDTLTLTVVRGNDERSVEVDLRAPQAPAA
jgi:S1-C subfamily serine protease